MGKVEHLDPPPPYPANNFRKNLLASTLPYEPRTTPKTVNGIMRVVNLPLRSRPTTLVCPSCGQTILTKVVFEPGSKTHLACLFLCLIQCYLCCFLPYWINCCQSGIHSCPNCHAYIGTSSD